jgi:tRNA-dihydrouridine synthase C
MVLIPRLIFLGNTRIICARIAETDPNPDMRLILAPMEGVIDHTMRELLTSLGGIDRCVTEFVRVTDTVLPARVFRKRCPELTTNGHTPGGVPVYVQLLGGQAEIMAANALVAAQQGAPGIDLNFGCPAKTVNASDGGSIILRDPDRVHRIVSAVREAVPAHIPVTVKTRLGYEHPDLFPEIVQAVVDAGASELAIHARTKRQGYRPPAYWDDIAMARNMTDIPIIANGEIWSPADALRCREVTGCADLMLGRGVLCRPDLPRLVAAMQTGETIDSMHWPDILPLMLKFYDLTVAHYDACYVGSPIKQWLVYLRSYFPQASVLFEQVKRLREPEDIRRVLYQTSQTSSGMVQIAQAS